MPTTRPNDRSKSFLTVSNRLPITISSDQERLVSGSGGLITAIRGIGADHLSWIGGVPGNISESKWKRLYKTWKGKEDLQPIMIDPELYNSYYNGFCNDLLWPLLHYENGKTISRGSDWEAYQKVNELFAEKIIKKVRPDETIWIHDFHLFLLPKLLREKRKKLKIGFFLHVPFPSSEVFRQLPQRKEILESLLQSNLIGFHDYSYLRHFCSSVLRILGADTSELAIEHNGFTSRLGVFPVSIDTKNIRKKSLSPETKKISAEFKTKHFSFLGVDRMDYSKGLLQKLNAFQNFLRKNPQYIEKVRLIQVGIPTRTDVPEYIDLRNKVNQMVGEINGEFGTVNWVPVSYINNSIPFDQLVALYQSADALLVTSKRDGMNLVTLEYIASQRKESPGVVILSEFTGALSMLNNTLAVNPWDPDEISQAMKRAIEMKHEEKLKRWQDMLSFLTGYSAVDWANSFMGQLNMETKQAKGPEVLLPSKRNVTKIAKVFKKQYSGKPNVFLDYDGTLVPIKEKPEEAVLNKAIRNKLNQLAKEKLNIVVVSGRPSEFLSAQFNNSNLHLVAEHGATELRPSDGKWRKRISAFKSHWYPSALRIMQDYASRVQGSHVEKKAYSISWHYRQASEDYGLYQSLKLQEELEMVFANQPVTILRGKKVLEVRAAEANKGYFVSHYLDNFNEPVPAIAIGDDETDEDMFQEIKNRGLSIKVGTQNTCADFRIESQHDILPFLEQFADSL